MNESSYRQNRHSGSWNPWYSHRPRDMTPLRLDKSPERRMLERNTLDQSSRLRLALSVSERYIGSCGIVLKPDSYVNMQSSSRQLSLTRCTRGRISFICRYQSIAERSNAPTGGLSSRKARAVRWVFVESLTPRALFI
jgi:hypothetical protein